MKITDEMVETAAQALHHIDGTGTHPQWDLEWDYVKADYLLQARAALEAVAPMIAAKAWDEGAHAAWERSTPEVNAARYHWRHEGEPTNPYRSAP